MRGDGAGGSELRLDFVLERRQNPGFEAGDVICKSDSSFTFRLPLSFATANSRLIRKGNRERKVAHNRMTMRSQIDVSRVRNYDLHHL